MLALWLTRMGVKARIVDMTRAPGTTSRALVMHARTLEFYRQLGIAEEAIARGLKFAAANLWVRGEKAGRVVLGDMGEDLSPFPYMLILAQDRQEALLIEHLAKLGVQVERETELLSFEDRGDTTRMVLHELYPSGEAFDAAAGAYDGMPESFDQLDELLAG